MRAPTLAEDLSAAWRSRRDEPKKRPGPSARDTDQRLQPDHRPDAHLSGIEAPTADPNRDLTEVELLCCRIADFPALLGILKRTKRAHRRVWQR